MKLTKIQIENLGPYIGSNQLNFSIDDNSKRIVLIGGKNGAGKTTLFNAIRIGLYGSRAFGYEANNSRYMSELSKIINQGEKLNKNCVAKVIIELLMDDGMYDNLYKFERIWKLTTKQLREEYNLYKDGKLLSATERSDFESYLLQLIPPDLFKFYFFDGEQISNFVFSGIKNTDFKNAFLKLCGLDTMEIILDNFRRTSRIRLKADDVSDRYFRVLAQQKERQQKLHEAILNGQSLSDKMIEIDEQLTIIDSDYANKGGISQKEWKSMQNQILKEEANRENNRKWLKDMANNVIPFVILKDELAQLRIQIEAEDSLQVSSTVQNGLSNPELIELLNRTFSSLGIELNQEFSEKTIDIIKDFFAKKSNTQPLLYLSKQEQLDILSLINSLQAFDVNRIKEATDGIDFSLQRVKRIRKKLEKSEITNHDVFIEKKSILLDEKSKCIEQLAKVEHEIEALRNEVAVTNSVLRKAKENYEEFLRIESVKNISARALLAFDDLQSRLYKKYIRQVEEEFYISFHALINNSDLIDGIRIDEQLQVLPYKKKKYKKVELIRMVEQLGDDYILNQLGEMAFNEIQEARNSSENEITLTVEVKQQLSAGEKQVFIMALYQALSKLNKVNVPYIIDTPFARIDTSHRFNILSNFFMKLKGQVIILSTDEEIVSEYKNHIEKLLSDMYLLNHTDGESTQIINNAYFGGAI